MGCNGALTNRLHADSCDRAPESFVTRTAKAGRQGHSGWGRRGKAGLTALQHIGKRSQFGSCAPVAFALSVKPRKRTLDEMIRMAPDDKLTCAAKALLLARAKGQERMGRLPERSTTIPNGCEEKAVFWAPHAKDEGVQTNRSCANESQSGRRKQPCSGWGNSNDHGAPVLEKVLSSNLLAQQVFELHAGILS